MSCEKTVASSIDTYSLVRLLEAGDASERRGLPAPAGPQKRRQRPLLKVHREVVDRDDVAVFLEEIADPNAAHSSSVWHLSEFKHSFPLSKG